MSKLPVHSSRLQRVALAALLATLSSGAAHAASVTVTSMAATGFYQLGGDASVSLLDAVPPNLASSVDVLSFPGSGGNSAGLHSYGDSSGNFGSRSSGGGIYDVTGGYSIGLHIANNGATAQRINFGFHITPGYIQNGLIGFGAGQYVEAGISFNIQQDTGSGFNSIWSTSGSLTSNAGGTAFTKLQSDPTINLFSGSGPSRSVDGKTFALDLGVLNAGMSMDLSYDIRSYAKGNALDGTVTHVPEQIIHVPDQWVEYCSGGYGYGDKVCMPQLTAGYDQVIPAYDTFAGQTGTSQASSGDPFDISSSDGSAYHNNFGPKSVLPAGVVVGVTAVPEPATYGMAALGLLLVGGVARRRQRAG